MINGLLDVVMIMKAWEIMDNNGMLNYFRAEKSVAEPNRKKIATSLLVTAKGQFTTPLLKKSHIFIALFICWHCQMKVLL